ncbi:MAG: hypothetical protein ACJ786_41140 [Catenulispora sp.]
MANPYQGQALYDQAWQSGYDQGSQSPQDSDTAPPVFPPWDLDDEHIGYAQQVWREGALAGRDAAATASTPAPAPTPAPDSGSATPATPALTPHEPSLEAREREREVDDVTTAPRGDDSWFQSDWAGRAILARYLAGDGDWDLDDEHWAAYMRYDSGLRHRLDQHVRYLISNVAAQPDGGSVPVSENFAVEIQNGEGIIGYQYLHGTNADAGGFTIQGWAHPIPGHDDPDANQTSAATRVQYYLEYTWNDIIDPNPQYGTDIFKAAIADAISGGVAAAYRISIKWHGEGLVTVGPNGEVLEILETSGSGDALNCYPLR